MSKPTESKTEPIKRTVSPTDLAWIAGVVDFKGKLSTKNNAMRATPQRVLYVETKELVIAQELARLTGTAPEARDQKEAPDFWRHACTEHCPEAHVHVDAKVMIPRMTRWQITGVALAIVVWNILPYLRNEHGLLQAMHDSMAAATLTGQGSGSVRKAIKRLRELGWKIPPELRSSTRTSAPRVITDSIETAA